MSAELERFANFLDRIEDLSADIASEAASDIQSAAREMYASGIGPSGAHAPRKKDGARALQRPLAAVTFPASGAALTGQAGDVLRYHQGPIVSAPYPERKTFPGDGEALPTQWSDKIDDAVETVFAREAGV